MRNVAWGARILPVFVSFKHAETKKTADLVTFTEELFNEKLHFLCSVKDFEIWNVKFRGSLLRHYCLPNM